MNLVIAIGFIGIWIGLGFLIHMLDDRLTKIMNILNGSFDEEDE